jgi:phosphatidylserine/phosphatidylglycerophosphate/cardiolipin synthase-like enzyme
MEFLTTRKITSALEDIIIEAQELLILISPFVFIPHNLVPRLKDAVDRGVRVVLVMKDEENKRVNEQEVQKFDFIGLKVLLHPYLHGKAYLNEKSAIITSFNLIDSSEKNNIEFGILLSKHDSSEIFNRILSECDYVIRKSNELDILDDDFYVRDIQWEDKFNNRSYGFCIACRKKIEKSLGRPFCIECYRGWGKNLKQPLNYCHLCGIENDVVFESPICPKCI